MDGATTALHDSEQSQEQQQNGNGDANAHDAPDKQPEPEAPKPNQPPGGYDSTPIPHAPPGYTVKITFHRAINLPMADLNTLSSDPFIMAQIYTRLPPRHKEDPALIMRTPTIRRCTDPEWNSEWIVANIPASGFKMKVRIYDEDPADHDDRLGNAHVEVGNITESWEGIKEQPFDVKKRMGSKRAYALRAVAVCFSQAKHMDGTCYISVEVLGKTPGDEGGRAYTIGPNWWTRHYSPLLGRIANRKDSDDDADDQGLTGKERKRVERYNFQANQFQLRGPVPAELYHRYVEFKPFVKSMFTSSGIRGFLLSKALHHQHNRVYNFDKMTIYGTFPEGPSTEMTLKFLDLVHYDQGGRIFTYVLTLDALFRFTETGKEFGIDMLSKHTMHSDVSTYIAFSGEFFVRRLAHAERPPPSPSADDDGSNNETHPPKNIPDGPPDAEPPKDPSHYELVIDNDSGTYRPNPALLPLLKQFLSAQFPGLTIVTLDCTKDEETMNRMKQEQRDRKATEGDNAIYRQASNGSSSISSSDEEDLEDRERANGASKHDDRVVGILGRQMKGKQGAKMDHLKDMRHVPMGGAHAERGSEGEAAA